MRLSLITTRDEADERLMERFVAEGNGKAFEELYHRYAPRLKGFFVRMLSDPDLADDCLQELFLRIYEARESYRADRRFSTWVFAMAYNLCKNEYRHREVVEAYASRRTDSGEEERGELPDFGRRHDLRVFGRQLRKALALLSDEQRAAYTLRYEEDLSVQEIAQVLRCPEGTVKSRLFYALKTLQRCLSEYNPIND